MCKEGRVEEASVLFGKMEEDGLVPSAVTYNILIDGHCNKGDLGRAFGYREEMLRKGIMPTVSTYNLLIHELFMECRVAEADDMVKEMGEKGMSPDAVTYNILINGYCRSGNAKKAFNLHDEMLTKGIQPTRVTYTSLIYVLSKRNRMKEADDLFVKIKHRGVLPDVIMFNALIDGHCANGNMERALLLLKEMDRMKVPPDEVTYNTLMQGHCREGKVEEARGLLDEMKRRGIKPDHISYNTLISGYSRRGDMKDAFRVRDEMLRIGFNPTLLTYNALIQGDLECVTTHIASKNASANTLRYLSSAFGLKWKHPWPLKEKRQWAHLWDTVVPGLALTLLGLWHTINTIRAYYLSGSGNFMSRFWYPLKSPLSKLEHLELIFVLSFSVFAIFMQVLDFPLLHFSFKLDNFEHATMFFHLAIFAGFALSAELTHSSEILSGVCRILLASVFGQQLFLLHYHSTDHVGLEGHYHWLLQLIVFVSLVAALSTASSPTSFPAALVLSISVLFQGCWFMNMGFVLWVPRFVPVGCIVQLGDASRDNMHGAVTCATPEADLRARALAHLQFSWILAGILIFIGCICLKFARNFRARGRASEYEELHISGAEISVAMTGFKQVHP
ncbi:hypothetical protein F0562_028627 [Nyssa sinensis]|uniref:Uncharacterized protein n=1 Tax=Nyssa sinensis TaxID=561372 RepID=A0A5J5B0I0_9ASTE|nr:hypothetical protein F0562_028627 [Nyssa sinensis]